MVMKPDIHQSTLRTGGGPQCLAESSTGVFGLSRMLSDSEDDNDGGDDCHRQRVALMGTT